MVILKVNLQGVAVSKLECDPPRAIDLYRVSLRLAPQTAKVEPWQIHVIRPCSFIQNRQSITAPIHQVGADLARVIIHDQHGPPLVAEALNHRARCSMKGDRSPISHERQRIAPYGTAAQRAKVEALSQAGGGRACSLPGAWGWAPPQPLPRKSWAFFGWAPPAGNYGWRRDHAVNRVCPRLSPIASLLRRPCKGTTRDAS